MTNRLLDLKEAAEFLILGESTLARFVKNGTVPGVKIGGQWRFNTEVLKKFFQENIDMEVRRGKKTG